ncbi:Alanine racemase [compost metagenome]
MKIAPSHLTAVGLLALSIHALAAPVLQDYNFQQDVSATIAKSNAWLEISKSAFKNNIEFVRGGLSKGSSLCAVMKADAYGHGIALLIPTIIESGINCIGIASNEEARIARSEGYKGKILRVRQAAEGEIQNALQYEIEELIGNVEIARAVSKLAEENGKIIKIHLVTNAGGMSRNGLDLGAEKGKKGLLDITSMKGLKVTGIMTHFAVEEKEFVMSAYDKFMSEQDWIIKSANLNRNEITLHCANSFATLDVPTTHLDMVRVGGALYGDLIGRSNLKRVMSLKSKVASINSYPAGNTVGYDRTITLNRDSKLANVPVGY